MRGGNHSSGTAIACRLKRPTRRLGRAALGLDRSVAGPVEAPAYAALLPMGFAVPLVLPRARWALTPPFHPYRRTAKAGATEVYFSVALSSAFPPPDVIRHRALWSSDFPPAAVGTASDCPSGVDDGSLGAFRSESNCPADRRNE
jgi:hypothetical protein